jgi:hypothetical protein
MGGAKGSISRILPLLSGCVGEGAALEFCQWVRELDLPDPEGLLANPKSYVHPERADQAYAILSAVVQRAIGAGLTAGRWKAAWEILSRAAEAGGADIAAAAARSLASARGDREDLLLPRQELSYFLPVLRSAGMIGA